MGKEQESVAARKEASRAAAKGLAEHTAKVQEELKQRAEKAKAEAAAKAKALERQRTLPKVDKGYTFKGRAASERSEKAGSLGKPTDRGDGSLSQKKGADKPPTTPVARAASLKKPTAGAKPSASPAKGASAKQASPRPAAKKGASTTAASTKGQAKPEESGAFSLEPDSDRRGPGDERASKTPRKQITKKLTQKSGKANSAIEDEYEDTFEPE